MIEKRETTDLTLFVRTSDEDSARWNRQRIVDALIRETDIDVETAETISREVEKQIISSGISLLTTPLIRELVNAKLIERGLEQERRKHAPLGFPIYDVRQLILHENKENASVPHGPEGTNLILAEGIKREFAIHEVFSPAVVDAHIGGDFHLHGLGYIDRPYSLSHSLEFLKRFGLDLPLALTAARPAKHAEVLLAHMVRFGAILQGHFAGAISWDAVNYLFAPYTVDMNDREVGQLAQMLVYEFSQMTSARGGQAIFTNIHIYWEVPALLNNVMAIGPQGRDTGKPYQEYAPQAQRLARAIFEVFSEGDAAGLPFVFPRPIVHISEDFYRTPGHEEFLDLVCRVASEKGNPSFAFDRPDGTRMPYSFDETIERSKSEAYVTQRCASIQNVSLNLPRLGYKSQGNEKRLFAELSETLALMAEAHAQKRVFLEKLLSYGETSPLAMLIMNRDGYPYLRMDRSAYLMGMVGLNELIEIVKGKQMHQSDEALSFGLKVVAFMRDEVRTLARRHKMRLMLEQTLAETTSYRFARLDLKQFSPESGRYVRGNIARGEIYYTNSTHMNVSAPLDPLKRVLIEGRFHSLIGGGVMTQLWLGEEKPPADRLAAFTRRVLQETANRQIAFSPDFTACSDCGRTVRGLAEGCPFCGSNNVEGIARITQYFSKVSGWNQGKLAELRDRYRNGNFPE
ncbi:MAG: anaerobic ribonucleoside-triphosphate reductase [Deltaproteobacteria bacterium]|nr:anaerobic ribonucleoside-triphosphate reductase [Deltaproteobacteria bacterium]